MLGDGHCQSECNSSECYWDAMDCGCASDCTSSSYGNGLPECFVPECAYDGLSVSGFTCADAICSWIDDFYQECFVITDRGNVRMDCCENCCMGGYLPHPDNPFVCIRNPDKTTLASPRLLYVDGNRSDGDGSLERPFPSLRNAVLRLYERFSTIVLIQGTYVIEPAGALIQSIVDYYSGYLMPSRHLALEKLTITSYGCDLDPLCDRATLIYSRERKSYFIYNQIKLLEVTYIDIRQSEKQPECGKWEPCSYGGNLFSSRYSRIRLAHVSIRFFPTKMHSIFSLLYSEITLEDVDFEDIAISADPGSGFFEYGDLITLTFRKGSLRFMNPAYDYSLTFSGMTFFQTNYAKLLIEDVTFSHNFYDGTTSDFSYAIFDIKACFDCVFRRCVFENNIGKNIVSYVASRLADIDTDPLIMSGLDLQNRTTDNTLLVIDCIFRNNTGSLGSALFINFPSMLHNVRIENCSFINELAVDYGIIAISSSRALSLGSFPTWKIMSDTLGRLVKVAFVSAEFAFADLTFINCTTGNSRVISVTNIPRLTVKNLLIESSGSFLSPTRVSNTLEAYGLKQPTGVPETVLKDCQRLLEFSTIANVTLEGVSASDAKCDVIVQVSCTNLRLSNSSLAGLKSGSAFYLNVSESVAIENLTIEHNTVPSSPLYVQATEVTVTRSVFRSNSAPQGAALFLHSITRVQITDSNFTGNSGDSGAGVYFQLAQTAFLSVQRCLFQGNSARDIGGAVMIGLPGDSATLSLQVSRSVFTANSARYGSALLSSAGIRFNPGSAISHCQFDHGEAVVSGTVHFSSFSGELAVTESNFTGNSGSQGVAMYMQALADSFMRLELICFDHNSGTSIVQIRGGRASVADLQFTHNDGSCLSSDLMEVSAARLRFEENRARFGPAFLLTSSNVSVALSFFADNTAIVYGGAVLVDRSSTLQCADSVFINNSGVLGGALYAKQHSRLGLLRVRLERNSAKEGFALFISGCETASVIEDCTFLANSGEESGVVSALSSAILLRNCTLQENESVAKSAGLVLQLSELYLTECVFASQSSVSGSYIYLFHSTASILFSRFEDAAATAAGGAVFASDSTLLIYSSDFRRLSAKLGGAIATQNDSNLTLHYCLFADVEAKTAGSGAIDCTDTVLEVSNSKFERLKERAVAGTRISMTVSYCEITGSKFAAGVSCSQCYHTIIDHSLFSGLSAEYGSAIYLYKGDGEQREIQNCTFERNSASAGGAIYMKEVAATVHSSVFRGNTAVRGGAVVLASEAGSFLLVDSTFTGNIASVAGGAIAWVGAQPQLTSCEFEGNSASYGNDTASYAVQLAVEASSSLLPSGQRSKGSISLVLRDHYGAVVTTDNYSDAHLFSNSSSSVSGVTRVVADRGRFVFNDFVVIAQPGTNATLRVVTSGVENAVYLAVWMRECQPGETQSSDQCIVCEPGTYSLHPSLACSTCPPAAVCLGNFTMVPRAKYWRADVHSDKFFECPNPDSCLGSSTTSLNMTGECAEGYTGNKCQSCVEKYYRWGRIYCFECPSVPVQVVTRIVVLLVTGLLVAVSVRTVLRLQGTNSVYIKLYINYMQLVMLLDSFRLGWPYLMLQLFQAQQALGAFPEVAFSANCLGHSEPEAYFNRLLIMALVQPALVLCSCVTWALIVCRQLSVEICKNQMVASGIVVFFFAYPSVVRAMMEVFNCEEIKPGEFWIVGYEIRCWTQHHLKYALGLALPSLLVWGAAVPGILALAIHLQRNSSPVRYNFLVGSYRKEHFYWEFVLLLRKSLIVSFSTLMSRVPMAYQVLSALGVLALSIMMQRAFKPFAEPIFNQLELKALLVTAATLYAGLFYFAGALNASTRILLFTAVTVANLYFTFICLRRPFLAAFSVLRKTLRSVKSRQDASVASIEALQATNQ